MTAFINSKVAFTIVGLFAATGVIAEETIAPIDQNDINAQISSGQMQTAFIDAFEAGDELTEFQFDASQGVGAKIGEGRIFTRIPRADLDGPEEWANHFPKREGGANATSCIACHNAPFANGAGDVALNVVVDPAHTGDPALYLERNTLPLFALGVTQRIAEEISLQLYVQRAAAQDAACQDGSSVASLSAKGVFYGTISMTRTATEPCVVETDASGLLGVDDDLVVRAFGWKGNEATIRGFTRNAAHNELGLQAVELVGDADGDYDGVTGELSVGDMTALSIYMAALERPVSQIELADLGLLEMDDAWRDSINAGASQFETIGCALCHTPSMTIDDPEFAEPSSVPGFYDATFPDGSNPADHGIAMETAVRFDLSKDQPNNHVVLDDGTEHHLGALSTDENGAVVAMWYSDFKRHDMGEVLADPADPLGIGAAAFFTRPLAGVGSTGPWLHDGRATTLDDAILAHGGVSSTSRDAFAALSDGDKADLVTFLENLVLYSHEAH